jgi:hypothetical protein
MTQTGAAVSAVAPDSVDSGLPALSVVLITPAGYDEIRTTLSHLSAQDISDRIEMVIVAPDPDRVRLPESVTAAFHNVRVVPASGAPTLSEARAMAVGHATAPIVAFSEDHSFPEPGWARALLSGHAHGYAGVAPEMKNGNPVGMLSRVAMFLHFGGVVRPGEAHETTHPAASHNMSYRRDVLLALGNDLARRLLAEGFLHDALRERGHRFRVEPAAATRHINMSRLRPLLRHAWLGGRLYGGLRQSFAKWSAFRRLVYACGSPLVPFIRLRRTLGEIRRAGQADHVLPWGLPPMFLILVVHAAGEAAGYVLGPGPVASLYSDLEVRRDRFVLPAERALWT